jgi:FAD/FMN-containing dehydrogenase
MLGPEGERILWFHAMLPNSQATRLFDETEAVFDAHRAEVERFGIRWGYLISVNGPSTFGIEPVVYWRDAPLPIHREYIDAPHLAKLPVHPGDAAAREAVVRIRGAVVERWARMGATHLQIGRQYPFLSTRTEGTAAAMRAIKQVFDPQGLFNPGVLGA